jgi:hypothetical protein
VSTITEEKRQVGDAHPKLSEQEIKDLVNKVESGEIEEKTPVMEQYEDETGKYAIWRGKVTEGFKKWLKFGKVSPNLSTNKNIPSRVMI